MCVYTLYSILYIHISIIPGKWLRDDVSVKKLPLGEMPECSTLRLWRHTPLAVRVRRERPELSSALILSCTISLLNSISYHLLGRELKHQNCQWLGTEREAQRTDPIPAWAHHSRFSVIHRHVVLQSGVYLLHRDRVIFGIYFPLLRCRQDNGDGLLAHFQDNLWWANLCLEEKRVSASSGVKQPRDNATAQPFLDQRPKTTLLWETLSP